MVEVGRDLWSSSGPCPWFRQGHLELVGQDRVQTALNTAKDGDFTTLLGNCASAQSSLQ